MMKIIKILSFIPILLCVTIPSYGQELTQVVRGKVIDSETRRGLEFATVTIVTTEPQLGAITDVNGYFRIENVPVGRHNIQVSYLGYEPKLIPELMISSAKEIVLNIELKEKPTSMDEVTVKAYTKKDKPLNSMSTLSARTFSVEEAQRYAAGFDDPARLVSSFAGITTGVLEDNGIIIRGNAPKGLLWRLEGIEISNPNHFAGATTIGGGGVSALSSFVLANSDFFTGAFPAEYGNAMSGVFDIKLRTGNNENYEHAFQAGFMGIDFSSEGPFSKNSNASYLFNYRYSTFGLIKFILPEGTNVPIYQDLCLKINMPTKNAGVFSFWALGADDKTVYDAESDSSKWTSLDDQESGDMKLRMGAIGLNHRYIIGNKTYLFSSLAVSGNYTKYEENYLDYDLSWYQTEFTDYLNYKYTFTTALNHKFGRRHTNRTGLIINSLHYNTELRYAPSIGEDLISAADEKGSAELYNLFTQSNISVAKKLVLNVGVHGQYFKLNDEVIIEPRIGVTYNLTTAQSLSLAYGKHSRMEKQNLYFANVIQDNEVTQPNKNLRITKAHHFVMAYDISFNPNLRLKFEPYLQLLYDVPVIPDSSYSIINQETEWYFANKFTNDGTGTNFGIDLTLERFLNNGYYYLFTASLFESKYKGGDNKERDTRYNSNYVVNALFGKEWMLGASKNKILGVNARFKAMGGQRMDPLDRDLSNELGEVKFDHSRPFEDQKPNIYQLDLTISYRSNKKNHANIWSLQVLNVLGRKEFYGYSYSYVANEVEEELYRIIVPNLSFKIEF